MLLPAAVAWWLAAEITGFALMFRGGVDAGGFRLATGLHSGIGAACYLSAGAETSLTFGDAVPIRDLYRALVDLQTILGLTTFTLAAIRWSLRPDDPMASDSWVAALLEQYSTTIRRLQRSFVGPRRLQPSSALTFDNFQRTYPEPPESRVDHSVYQFRQLQDRTRIATDLPPPPDPDVASAFSGYQEWLEFDTRQTQILDRVRAKLGYSELAAS
jgi:hypothetical protein